MRVGMVVFANKWTGAGAVAEMYCRALHSVGVEASLLFVGGRNLERRLSARSWAHPDLAKERSPGHVRKNLQVIRQLAANHEFVICHLPHDHLLCVAAGVHRRVSLIRSFRRSGYLRGDPYHRFLNRRLSGAFLAYSDLESVLRRKIDGVPTVSLPVPIEDRFRPTNGSGWRDRLGIPQQARVVGAVGKLAKGRGFETLLATAARLASPVHVVVVGHGERMPKLRALASILEMADRVHWVGYREKDLPDLYAAMDVSVFAAPGSDWGHRAISEAQACGRPVVAIRCPGVGDLVEDGVTGRIVDGGEHELAATIDSLLTNPGAARDLGEAAAKAAQQRSMAVIGGDMKRFLLKAATLGQ